MSKDIEMPRGLPPFRRVITGLNDNGQSTIAADGPPDSVMTVEARPGFRTADIYRTAAQSSVSGDRVAKAGKNDLLPSAGGTVVRVVDFPPEPKDPDEYRRQVEGTLQSVPMQGAALRPERLRHPLMHSHATVDYVVVTHGEIYAVMEAGEVKLTAGDVLVQRGTNHAWSNRSEETARLVFVLVDGK